ncbi:unnamed protein product [Rotaria sordida]|uniref:Uncharacterized protein n=2 Tax=Rotaria sordida TaxID=392033 RepID=A0A819FNJ0_9BILA|nr:unnamed protein product [Rotaria sordida]CAF3868560.1 unnamed protein product [Rotaria sordida]CAF3958552.1 unnamed protein product [Rotaria sordida]
MNQLISLVVSQSEDRKNYQDKVQSLLDQASNLISLNIREFLWSTVQLLPFEIKTSLLYQLVDFLLSA